MHHRLTLSLALLCACSTRPTSDAPLPEPAPITAPLPGPADRLPTDVRPTRYVLDLTVDPSQPTFAGHAEIEVALDQATAAIVLHGQDLTLTTTFARAGGRDIAAVVDSDGAGVLRLRFAEPLPAGTATLVFDYSAPLAESMEGLYRVEENGAWYAFTQFEPLDGRRAFPCFDEPAFKAPFEVTLRVPTGLVAAANAPLAVATEEPGTTVHRFEPTPPLPTYLVAMAVGPFDVVEAPAGAAPIPLRVLTPRGDGALAAYPLEQTPRILEALSEYFGEPYPFAKLDLVAVPNFAYGAMENAGLITFRARALLVGGDDPPAVRAGMLSIVAHELAHMWFGDLVTLTWWDDLWLNEAFATWMATRTVDVVAPELEAGIGVTASAGYVMSTDAQRDARAIRQPITGVGDVLNAFDGITYTKGAAVLRMTEAWLGEDAFRAGVREYFDAHRWGNATTDDLLSALSAASGRNVGETLGRFLDQPGVPLLDVQWSCDAQMMQVTLSQRRYLPAGSDAPQGEPWQVPVCLRHGADEVSGTECVVLEGATGTFDVAVDECPQWVYPNAEARGYYRWALPEEQLGELLSTHRSDLTLRERVALPSLLRALLEAERIDVGAYLSGLASIAEEDHRFLVDGVISGLYGIDHVVEPDLRAHFAQFVRALLEPHGERLGSEPIEGEPVADRMLRPNVIDALAVLAEDPALRSRARANTDAFLMDASTVVPDVARESLPVAAQFGDAPLWEALRTSLDDGLTPVQRALVVSSLGSFRDPALAERSFGLLLDGTLRAQDMWSILGNASGQPETRETAWAWLGEQYDALVALVGPTYASDLPWMGAGFCTMADADRVHAFFDEPSRAVEGSERNLGLVVESIQRCARLREATAGGLRAFLVNF